MRTTPLRRFALLALACGCSIVSTRLFAQPTPVGPPNDIGQPVPVGPPDAVSSAPLLQVPFMAPFSAAPEAPRNGGIELGQSFTGIDFINSTCRCIPPDTNVAVGNNFVVEAVNTHMRVFDKNTGGQLLTQQLALLFGAPSRGDPYVVYDDNADRWYLSAFDTTGEGVFVAVSQDGDPLHGFRTFHLPNLHAPETGWLADYQKLGFNKDAIFISYNNFGHNTYPALTIASIDKAAALSGNFVYYYSTRSQFRAMPPAQMHHDIKGGTEWFVSTDGTESGGDTIRVTKMTRYLSDSPQFEETSVPVSPYRSASLALQPGGSITTFPNTTTTQVQYHKGRLVTAMASATAGDGFITPKGLYYQIDVNGRGASKPRLMREGIIDPGRGIAVQMPSVDEDQQGNLGFTWMESSASEYLSMWIGNLYTDGRFSSQQVAAGGGFFYLSYRIGDYSSTVLDPDGKTFWSANEYIGSDWELNAWRTYIASFTAR